MLWREPLEDAELQRVVVKAENEKFNNET